ncbi:hypothetical protein AAHB37_17320 [Glutamicibacter halophytocola]|uniref:hypothetical protein n=1 Tax=Glutamicibacter halophytocola TaxID=1933880 RepID=UPI00321A40BE
MPWCSCTSSQLPRRWRRTAAGLGRLLAVYLIGSSLTPVIGAGLLASLGNQGFTLVLAIASMALAVPAVAVALFSSRGNRATEETAPPAESLPIASKSLEA